MTGINTETHDLQVTQLLVGALARMGKEERVQLLSKALNDESLRSLFEAMRTSTGVMSGALMLNTHSNDQLIRLKEQLSIVDSCLGTLHAIAQQWSVQEDERIFGSEETSNPDDEDQLKTPY